MQLNINVMKALKDFSNDLYMMMNKELKALDGQELTPMEKISRSIDVVKSHLLGLKNFVNQYEFKTKDEEIYFFKDVKVLFYSEYLFFEKLFKLELTLPSDTSAQRQAYLSELGLVNKFVSDNHQLFSYYINKSTYLDEKYFTGLRPEAQLNVDVKFCSSHDKIFSEIRAYEKLRLHLLKEIAKLDEDRKEKSPIKWTGMKTDLIELLYALHAAGVFNNAKADIKQLAKAFENAFNVDLGNYYNTFKEIRLRKTNKIAFVNTLAGVLDKRIDEME